MTGGIKEIIKKILNQLFFIYFKKEDILRLKEEIEEIIDSKVEIEETVFEDYDYVDHYDLADGVMDLSSDSVEMIKIEREGWRIKNRDKIIEEIVKKYIEPEVPNDENSNFILRFINITDRDLDLGELAEDLICFLEKLVLPFERKYLSYPKKNIIVATILEIRNILPEEKEFQEIWEKAEKINRELLEKGECF